MITKSEAEEFLEACKKSYRTRLEKGDGMMVTVRSEMEHWEEYLAKNWPGPEKEK